MPTIRVNNLNIYYEIHGEGEALLLIPGLGNDVEDNEEIIRRLSQHGKVIAFDNRGAGRTDKPDIPYSMDMMAEDAAGLVQSLGIGQAHVLGVSMGGRIAMALVLRHPEIVKSLILVSTSPKQAPTTSLGRLLFSLYRIPLVRKWGKKYPQPYHAFVSQREASRDFDATSRLHEIHVPTLILHGKKDKLAPYTMAEEMHSQIQSSEMVSFDGGHMFFLFRPGPFVNVVTRFLASLRNQSPHSTADRTI